MSARIPSLSHDHSGSAAVEMALAIPLLMVLMFGSFELGRYFLDSHTVAKAVRDGARFAARQSFTEMPCGGPAADEADIKDLVRTGTTANGGTPRLPYWTDPTTITVTVTCDSSGAYSASGIYAAVTGGARRVTVTATVPYNALFGAIAFETTGLSVIGRSEAAVMGV